MLMKLPTIVVSLVFSRKLLCVNKPNPFLSFSRNLKVLSSLRSQLEAPAWGSKKHKSKQKIKIQFINIMADPKIEEILAPFRASVKEQVISIHWLQVKCGTCHLHLWFLLRGILCAS